MTALHYIGDEIGAAGWRLAGAAVAVPEAGAERAALDTARADAALVLVAADVAARIDAAALREAVAALAPLVLVVPDTQGQLPLPDFAARLRMQLGLEK
jgi:vacuolar-type H+-ATPase subunit F/Vma7